MKLRTHLLALAPILVVLGAACAVSPGIVVSPQTDEEFDPFGVAPGEEERPDLQWFDSGWYVGTTIGSAKADASASEIDSALAARGYNTTTSFDDSDTGWKLYGGYRFDDPWAVELAIVDLGLVESTINTDAVDVNAFLSDVADVHPYSGAGIALSGIYYPVQTERVDIGVRAGLWVWSAEVDAAAALGQEVDLEDDGNVDPVLGVFGLVDLGRNFSARIEWERYFMDANDVDFFSIGLQYTLPL